MKGLPLGVLALLIGCSGCARRIDSQPPVLPTLGIHGAFIDPRIFPMLDRALADSVEHIYQVTDLRWEAVGNSGFVGDSEAVVTGLVQCKTWGRVDGYTIEHFTCPDEGAPTVHLHPSRRDCSPSRADFATQLRKRHRFDMVYCAPASGGTAYWLDRSPLLMERLLARAGESR
jgi:hypothetical protein